MHLVTFNGMCSKLTSISVLKRCPNTMQSFHSQPIKLRWEVSQCTWVIHCGGEGLLLTCRGEEGMSGGGGGGYPV